MGEISYSASPCPPLLFPLSFLPFPDPLDRFSPTQYSLLPIRSSVLLHHLLDPAEELLADERIGGVQHLLDRLQHVAAAAPVLAEDRYVGVFHDPVQHVDTEDEVVEVADRSQQRLGHDVEREDVVRDGADEQ